MKQILCVIDLTESAGKVLEVAAGLATACKAHLIVLFPYRLITSGGYQGDLPSLKLKLEIDAKEKFDELRKGLPGMESITYEFVCEIGFVSDRIEANIRKKKVDLVVIGQQQTHASADLRTFNLQELISASRLPFVIVPPPDHSDAKAVATHQVAHLG